MRRAPSGRCGRPGAFSQASASRRAVLRLSVCQPAWSPSSSAARAQVDGHEASVQRAQANRYGAPGHAGLTLMRCGCCSSSSPKMPSEQQQRVHARAGDQVHRAGGGRRGRSGRGNGASLVSALAMATSVARPFSVLCRPWRLRLCIGTVPASASATALRNASSRSARRRSGDALASPFCRLRPTAPHRPAAMPRATNDAEILRRSRLQSGRKPNPRPRVCFGAHGVRQPARPLPARGSPAAAHPARRTTRRRRCPGRATSRWLSAGVASKCRNTMRTSQRAPRCSPAGQPGARLGAPAGDNGRRFCRIGSRAAWAAMAL